MLTAAIPRWPCQEEIRVWTPLGILLEALQAILILALVLGWGVFCCWVTTFF